MPSAQLIHFATRTRHWSDVRDGIEMQAIANEIRDMFQNRTLPAKAQWLISGVIADLGIEATMLMEPINGN